MDDQPSRLGDHGRYPAKENSSMRFRLPTTLLGIAIVGVVLGWYVDHNALNSELEILKARHQQEIKESIIASSAYEHAWTLVDCTPNPIEPNESFDRHLIYALIDLCEQNNSIEKFNITENESFATDFASEILFRLECDSPEEFRIKATRLIIGGVPESFHPALHNSDSERCHALSDFLGIASDN